MKLTVLIPIFNTEPSALMEAVYSILNQDDQIEHPIILIDDGSTNKQTKNVIDYFSTLRFPTISVIYKKQNTGTSDALNAGHAEVKTEYVAIMGSDDISHKSRFRLQTEYLTTHTEVDVLGTNLFSFYDDDIRRTIIFESKINEDGSPILTTEKEWRVNHGTAIYRNSAVLAAGGYKASGRAQDLELWRRMIAAGNNFKNISPVLYGWRRYR